MDVGTAEIVDEIPELKSRRSGISGGSNRSSGGGGQNPGGGGDGQHPNEDNELQPDRFVPAKSRILTVLLLLVVVMTFGGLIAAYIVIATNGVAEWKPFDLPIQVWISTAIIVTSSFTYHFGKKGVERNDQTQAKNWFIITTVFGAAFISSQILAWVTLNARGFYVQSNPYTGFFYILTAVHAVHVLGGITALGSVLLRSWYPTNDPAAIIKRVTLAQVVGWYWHFMGGLWIVLFILLGFWK